MPLRNQIPAKLSARAVYAKQSASKGTSEKGRGRPRKSSPSPKRVKSLPASQTIVKKGPGRPRKLTASPVKVKLNLQKKNSPKTQKKISPKTRKRKNSVTFKSTTEIIENHSSEADLSSEGEETEQSNDDLLEDVEQDSNDIEVSDAENELEADEESGSSGEEEEDDEDIVGEEDEDMFGDEDEELATTDEIEGEQDDSEEAYYSFPEPSNLSSSNSEAAKEEQEDASSSDNSNKRKKNKDRISQAQSKKNIKEEENDEQEDASSSDISNEKENKDRISQVQLKESIKIEENAQNEPNSMKRKITEENTDDAEEEEQNEIKPKKKKKKIRRSNLPAESNARIYSPPGSSRIPSFSPQHYFNPNQSSTSFRSSAISPNPHVDSMDSLVRLNKSVPCGNIAADQAFRYLIGPTLPVDFFHNMFEKMPFTVPRENRHYYRHLFSGNDLNTMLKENNLDYKVHIDVVKYVKGMRLPVTADGRAYNSNVWEDYKQGFSLRVRNPQAYNKNLWRMCSLLQEYFSSTVGCNIYLTPPKAQGFPPHYDDIDAFIVQVEGRKYWKVYYPRYPEEELARYSSKDFSENEIGNPIVEVCLNAGEMLYIPRGYIHQAATDADHHSLHLTFSANQLNTWGDFLLIAASKAVEKAMLNDVTFRQSIPKDYMDYIGSCVANNKAFKRYELTNKVKELAKKAMSFIDVDEAADLHSLKFIEASLPPVFNKIEKEHSLHGNGSHWKNGEIRLKGLLQQDTEVQLIKKRSLRLVIGDNNPRLYHTLENQRDPRPVAEEEAAAAAYVDFEMDAVPAYLFLLHKHPDFVKVKDIPLDNPLDRVSFASSLYDNGLIITKEPLPRGSDEDYDWYNTSDDGI